MMCILWICFDLNVLQLRDSKGTLWCSLVCNRSTRPKLNMNDIRRWVRHLHVNVVKQGRHESKGTHRSAHSQTDRVDHQHPSPSNSWDIAFFTEKGGLHLITIVRAGQLGGLGLDALHHGTGGTHYDGDAAPLPQTECHTV
jgi:hypothetical protein